jgi:hypothetical protein
VLLLHNAGERWVRETAQRVWGLRTRGGNLHVGRTGEIRIFIPCNGNRPGSPVFTAGIRDFPPPRRKWTVRFDDSATCWECDAGRSRSRRTRESPLAIDRGPVGRLLPGPPPRGPTEPPGRSVRKRCIATARTAWKAVLRGLDSPEGFPPRPVDAVPLAGGVYDSDRGSRRKFFRTPDRSFRIR